MMHRLLALASLSLLVCLAFESAHAQTVLGVSVFSRHGDRTTRRFSGYGLTDLGYSQNYFVGSQYAQRYLSADSADRILGISTETYTPSQISASAPQQKILVDTATSFLQGLYPPRADAAVETLNNGSSIARPIPGYQYVFLRGEPETSPETINIKGDEQCPAYTSAAADYYQSDDFAQTTRESLPLYERMWQYIEPVGAGWTLANMTYRYGYEIFDAINVASIHNATSAARDVSAEDLNQLRYYADKLEYNLNYNSSQPMRSIGGQTLGAAMATSLTRMVSNRGRGIKFSLHAGSYDTMIAFFNSVAGLTGVEFQGLPDYASTFVLELLSTATVTEFPTSTDDLAVRFRFWNGSSIESPQFMQTYPLFGQTSETIPWNEFVTIMTVRTVSSVPEWCGLCSSPADFCLQYSASLLQEKLQAMGVSTTQSSNLSLVEAGVIGAMTTLALALLLAAVCAFFFCSSKSSSRRRRTRDDTDNESKTTRIDSMSSLTGEK